MLHELLLALSGYPSPLLSDKPFPQTLSPSLSPAETALLRSIAHLGNLHISIRDKCSQISSSHVSVICQATATAIASTHLVQFQKDIVRVERDILLEDASLVGAYQVVPLSAVAGAFEGWNQKLKWLQSILAYILNVNAQEKTKPTKPLTSDIKPATGAALIDRLRSETRTGYPEIEQMAHDLTKVAELAWLRQVSTWVLYGKLPTLGAADFFVHQVPETNSKSIFDIWEMENSLLPSFLVPETAHSILFIGKCLNYIQSVDLTVAKPSQMQILTTPNHNPFSKDSAKSSLLTRHLELIASLSHPIAGTVFTQMIGAIRSSLSQNVLQKMLSFTEMLQILHVFREFFLLQRGEFAIAMINAADACLASKSQTSAYTTKAGDARMSGVMIKEGEVAATLNQAWVTLASLQGIDDDEDQELDLARDLVHLTIKKAQTKHLPAAVTSSSSPRLGDLFRDVLLATPIVLTLRIASPLDLFLTSDDIETYSQMHAFLLSIRRAQSHLSDLWKLTSLRRDHSTALTPGARMGNAGKPSVKLEDRQQKRMRRMRRVWNMVGLVTAFLVELGEYFHGEVVSKSWERFESWFRPSAIHSMPPNDHRKDDQSQQHTMNEQSAEVNKVGQPIHDLETLMLAHRAFLGALSHALLLDDENFARSLRALLTKVDYLVGLLGRLSHLRVVSAARASHTASQQVTEEDELMTNIDQAGTALEKDIDMLKRRLRDLDVWRLEESLEVTRIEGDEPFTPWRAAGLDRLLLKVDSGTIRH